jgi:hypothetical protein
MRSISLVTAVFAAAARAIEPFDHGIWLVAYLFLVGFMAQYLLARGQSMLSPTGQPAADSPPIREQATLWNAGVVGVPVGVFADARLLVVLGSVALLASLGAFWHAYGSVRLEPDIELGALRVAYRALILFMALMRAIRRGQSISVPATRLAQTLLASRPRVLPTTTCPIVRRRATPFAFSRQAKCRQDTIAQTDVGESSPVCCCSSMRT